MFDQTPIHVIRRDLSSFYETIPLEPVRSRLLYDTAIPRSVRHYLHQFYEHHCGVRVAGLPRGIGLTTILVELSMQQFDDAIRAIPGVYRYFRYSDDRSEEHTSELQSLMRISYAVFCLKKKK